MTAQDRPNTGCAIINALTLFEGRIENGKTIEIYGEFRGEVATEHLIIHPGGRFFGTVRAGSASVAGVLQGDLNVRNLCAISATGDIVGKIHYGRLSMAEGANLDASVRNIPPEIGGDLEMTVKRGNQTHITTSDLTAFDPDDTATNLTFQVSETIGGHVAHESARNTPKTSFTQADLETGQIIFAHDGSDAPTASFKTFVTDASGATSGDPLTVRIAVR